MVASLKGAWYIGLRCDCSACALSVLCARASNSAFLHICVSGLCVCVCVCVCVVCGCPAFLCIRSVCGVGFQQCVPAYLCIRCACCVGVLHICVSGLCVVWTLVSRVGLCMFVSFCMFCVSSVGFCMNVNFCMLYLQWVCVVIFSVCVCVCVPRASVEFLYRNSVTLRFRQFPVYLWISVCLCSTWTSARV